ncbi:hypothetical protein NX059_002903 [Plenodomus lindquistii]|nr:hypothetical protein NX059_002903 [Plenodomus lindquistii]
MFAETKRNNSRTSTNTTQHQRDSIQISRLNLHRGILPAALLQGNPSNLRDDTHNVDNNPTSPPAGYERELDHRPSHSPDTLALDKAIVPSPETSWHAEYRSRCAGCGHARGAHDDIQHDVVF